jgi:hypothetical protein
MTERSRPRVQRVVVGSRVRLNVDDIEDLLDDMGLRDSAGTILGNVHMHGVVKNAVGLYWEVYLAAAEQAYKFIKGAVSLCGERADPAPYYVVVNNEVKEVLGLELGPQVMVDGYHRNEEDALEEINASTDLRECRGSDVCVCVREGTAFGLGLGF